MEKMTFWGYRRPENIVFNDDQARVGVMEDQMEELESEIKF